MELFQLGQIADGFGNFFLTRVLRQLNQTDKYSQKGLTPVLASRLFQSPFSLSLGITERL